MALACHAVRLDRVDDPAVAADLLLHWRAALMSSSNMRTPLGRVLGLGSAKSGTEHFWKQRLTAVANVPLTIAGIVIVIALLGRNHAATAQIIGSPVIA